MHFTAIMRDHQAMNHGVIKIGALMCPQADHLLSVPIMNLEDGVPVVCHIILEHSENEKNNENVPNILCRSKQKKSRPSKFVLSVT